VLDTLRRWLFPIVCIGCGRPERALCDACAPASADALRFEVERIPVVALAAYDGTWRRAIIAFKAGERAYAEVFARLLVARVPSDELIVPVTTTRRRSAERGFDQAIEVAARYAGSRAVDCLCKRSGPAQHGRTREERLAAAGRYHVREAPRITGRRVVLLDDVCTTGTTLRDAARALRSAGAAVAGAVVLARAQRFGGDEVS
jgi:ComF family protein